MSPRRRWRVRRRWYATELDEVCEQSVTEPSNLPAWMPALIEAQAALVEAQAHLAAGRRHTTRLRHHLACAVELVEERDRQLAVLTARCRRAEEERDLWRRWWDKSMPAMEA